MFCAPRRFAQQVNCKRRWYWMGHGVGGWMSFCIRDRFSSWASWSLFENMQPKQSAEPSEKQGHLCWTWSYQTSIVYSLYILYTNPTENPNASNMLYIARTYISKQTKNMEWTCANPSYKESSRCHTWHSTNITITTLNQSHYIENINRPKHQ